jgi:hypothetical protein
MIIGTPCALACTLAPWQAAIQPDSSSQINGVRVGTYVDDETPSHAAVIAADVEAGQAMLLTYNG